MICISNLRMGLVKLVCCLLMVVFSGMFWLVWLFIARLRLLIFLVVGMVGWWNCVIMLSLLC